MSGPIPGLWRLSSDDEGTISFEPYVPNIEALAALEHEQWAHWAEYMLDNLNAKNKERWRQLVDTPYSELNEDEKNTDREWAVRAIEVLGIEPA